MSRELTSIEMAAISGDLLRLRDAAGKASGYMRGAAVAGTPGERRERLVAARQYLSVVRRVMARVDEAESGGSA